MARFRRELRNPSMFTVIFAVVIVLAVPIGIFAPDWIRTTQESLEERRQSDELRDRTLISAGALVGSQITPWMLNQIETMQHAEGPASWKVVDFTRGPCDPTNLSQLPGGRYADAIATACADLDAIQKEYAGDCTSVYTCDLPEEAVARLGAVRADIARAFSDAGFVLPYSEDEQPVGP